MKKLIGRRASEPSRLLLSLSVRLAAMMCLVALAAPPASLVLARTQRDNKSSGTNRPNIVFILADDMGYGDLRSYNAQSKIPTPNMDRLATKGMRFTDAHTPSSVCTPTRYGLLTGRYAWRTKLKSGVLWGYDPLLIEPGRMTIASLLKRHGYATAVIGKWHLGLGNEPRLGRAIGSSRWR